MGFLKSLSRSIKRSATQQQPDDQVSEFGVIQAVPSPDTSTDAQSEKAGIKRPSGQGAIARRDRRRSSAEKLAVQTGPETLGYVKPLVSSFRSGQPGRVM
jgi:hypothetical protein